MERDSNDFYNIKIFDDMRNIFFILAAVVICFCSCSSSDDPNVGAQSSSLVGTKWTSQDWDYDFDDNGNWAYYYTDTYVVFFYSPNEGVAYYARKTTDSDYGNSHERFACFFNYSVNGNEVSIETKTDPFRGLKYYYSIEKGQLTCDGYDLKKGLIDNEDRQWLKTIMGETGDCKWYNDLRGGLTIVGEGKMADYKSFASTPWNNKYEAINYVEVKEGVKSIGSYAFASPSIGEVDIPSKKLEKIGDYAFSNSSIGTIYIGGEDLKTIGKGSFANCKYAKVYVPKGVEEIGDMAFYQCKSASLSETPKLRKVGNESFLGCQVLLWTNSEVLEFIGRGAFTNVPVQEINLPAIKELCHSSFSCTKINKIHIGPNLQKVTGTPFYGSSSGTLTIDVVKPLVLERDFVDENYVGKWALNVPTGSESNYGNAPYWKNFKTTNGGNNNGNNEPNAITERNVTAGTFSATLYGKVTGTKKTTSAGFLYGLTTDLKTNGDITNVQTNGDFNCEVLGLSENTTYYYCAYAYIGGKYYQGETYSFTTGRSECPSNLTYTINNEEYKMVLVSGYEGGDFYIMQTELPPASAINIGSQSIKCLDRNTDGGIITTEWVKFLNEIRVKTNIAFRMPTKKEWQYAACGGNKSKKYKYSGSNVIDDVAWYSGNSNKLPHDNAKKEPNELGLYDMSGNYSEVTNDMQYIYNVDGDICGGNFSSKEADCTTTSYQAGSQSGEFRVNGRRFKEKNAFNGKYSTVRLVFSKK